MRYKKLSALVITGALIASSYAAAFGEDYKTTLTLVLKSGSAQTGDVYDEAYTLEIPAALTITKEGWNSIGNMTASYGGTNDGFDPSKKLVVTAASTTGFNLTADGISDTIGYSVRTSASYSEATTTFEFTAAEINTSGGTSKPIGVYVDSFSGKSNATYTDTITYTAVVDDAITWNEVNIDGASDGTYTDEITYTVAIEDAGTTTTTKTVTWNASDITDQGSTTSFTKGSVTVTSGQIDFQNSGFYGPGTFTTTLGNFTKIEVQALDVPKGEGWSNSATLSGQTATWTGTASDSVSFTGDVMGISSITFTIE